MSLDSIYKNSKFKNIYIFIAFGITGFLFSFYLFPYYIGGDQIAYRNFYGNILDIGDLESTFGFYKDTVGAIEPGFFVFTYLLATFFEKDLIYSVINGLFMGLSVYYFKRLGASLLVILLLILNFYFIVLFFSTERLKLAFLLFEFAFIFKSWFRYVLLITSILFHLQMLIPLMVYLIWLYCGNEKHSKPIFIILIITSILFVCYSPVSSFLLNYVQAKREFYLDAGWGGFYDLIKPVILLSIAIFFSDEKKRFFYASLPVLIAAFLVGSGRVTIFAYALMLITSLRVRNGLNLPVVASGIYFAITGIIFTLDFMENGYSGN